MDSTTNRCPPCEYRDLVIADFASLEAELRERNAQLHAEVVTRRQIVQEAIHALQRRRVAVVVEVDDDFSAIPPDNVA